MVFVKGTILLEVQFCKKYNFVTNTILLEVQFRIVFSRLARALNL